MKRALLDRLETYRVESRPAAIVTRIADGAQALVVDRSVVFGDLEIGEPVFEAVDTAQRRDKSGPAAPGLFVQVFNPPLRMILVGAVHISQNLAPMAAMTGYDVTIIDPRGAWASEARFPDINVIQDWPEEAMERLAPDSRTAVVALTHDPKLDDPALAVALRSDAFYVGALGSRKTAAARAARLLDSGVAQSSIDRIDGPIGLDIGAVSPAEIAIAILGKVTVTLRGPKGG